MFRNGISKKDMILFEMNLLDTLSNQDQILFSRSNEKDTFQMH